MTERPTAEDVRRWAEELTAVGARIGRHFVRSKPRERAVGYVRELLGDVERKNGWQLAETLGDATPDGVQHLLARALWNADDVRDELVQHAAENLGDSEAVLVVDETGFLKKGRHSVGVARQYSGTAGRIENCQIGVFLSYVSARGRTLLDRALYLPKAWFAAPDRLRAAGVPAGVSAKTKIVLARELIAHAVAAGVPAKWATADAVYGADDHFRAALENYGLGYVVAVPSNFSVSLGLQRPRAKALLAAAPADAWQRISCGDGAKGPRLYDWAMIRTTSPNPRRRIRALLFRRASRSRRTWPTSLAAVRRERRWQSS